MIKQGQIERVNYFRWLNLIKFTRVSCLTAGGRPENLPITFSRHVACHEISSSPPSNPKNPLPHSYPVITVIRSDSFRKLSLEWHWINARKFERCGCRTQYRMWLFGSKWREVKLVSIRQKSESPRQRNIWSSQNSSINDVGSYCVWK